MTSNSTSDEVLEKALDKETVGSETVKKPTFAEKEKEISSGEPLPGWTIMRPLRKRGNKSSATATKADTSANVTGTNGIDSKADGDLKITETNDSGDGVGQVEALHDLRSDDELLGDEDEERGRTTRESGNAGDHTLQGNDGTAEERTAAGAVEYKVYKRRWFGLFQLVLLNIIVSWDVSSEPCLRKPRCVRERMLIVLASGSLFLRVRLQYPNTMLSRRPLSIGSVQGSSSPLLWYRLW